MRENELEFSLRVNTEGNIYEDKQEIARNTKRAGQTNWLTHTCAWHEIHDMKLRQNDRRVCANLKGRLFRPLNSL